MIDPNVLFMGGPAPLAQGIEIFKQDRQQKIANAQNQQQIDIAKQQNARADQLAIQQSSEFDLKIQELARQRQQDHVKQTASQVSSLLGRGDTSSAIAVLKKSMLDAQSIPELGGLADDYAQFGDLLVAGDVQTVKNQADAVMSAFTQTQANAIRSSQILPDGTVVAVTDSGTRVTDPTGALQTGQAAADAIRRANEYGVDIQTQREQGRRIGSLTAEGAMQPAVEAKIEAAKGQAKIATDAVRESYVMIPKVTKSIANIDSALAALDAGANSGAVSQYLPSIQDASIALDNSMQAMGLDVISSTTFGALSEGEMRMALQSAMPTGLSEPALKKYLQDKRAAQQKAREALQKAVTFLSQPNPDGTPRTVADWMRANHSPTDPEPESGAGNTPAPAAQPSASKGADAFVRQRQQTATPNETYEDRKRRLLGL